MAQDWSTMPQDLNELYNDLSMADKAGNEELAAVIAKRINMVKSATAGNVNMDEDTGGIEKFLIGAGRGAMDLAQGAKQKALMAGEALGIGGVEEGRAQEYSEEVAAEQKQFEDDFPGIGAESVGRFASWAAPAALTGGLGIPGTIIAGAIEGGVMPTENADVGEVMRNTALGAGVGAAGKAIQYGLQTPGGKSMVKGVTDKAEDMFNRYRPGKMQESFVKGIDDAKTAEGQLWQNLEGQVGGRQVDTTPVNEAILDEITRLQKSGGGEQTINKLASLWDDMPLGNRTPKQIRQGKQGEVTWKHLKEFRSNFAGKNKSALMNEGMSEAVIDRMYGRISETMKRNLDGDDEYKLFMEAVNATKDRKNLMKQTGTSRNTQQGIPNEKWFEDTMKGNNTDKISAVRQLMTDEGVEGARAQIMQKITGDFLEGGGKMPSTTKYKGMMNAVDELFDPDEAAEIRGFIKFMDTAKSEQSLQGVLKNVMGVGSVVGGVKALPAKFMLPSLMRSPETKALLQKLATTQPGTRLYQELTKRISTIMTQGAAGSVEGKNVPQIEIRNGIAQ